MNFKGPIALSIEIFNELDEKKSKQRLNNIKDLFENAPLILTFYAYFRY